MHVVDQPRHPTRLETNTWAATSTPFPDNHRDQDTAEFDGLLYISVLLRYGDFVGLAQMCRELCRFLDRRGEHVLRNFG